MLSDFGWLENGRLFLSYKLSDGAMANGIVTVPNSMKQYLQGAFALHVAESSPIGTLVIKGSQAWGLGPLFRRRGGDLGDTLRLIFDLKTKVVIAELGQMSAAEEDAETAQLPG